MRLRLVPDAPVFMLDDAQIETIMHALTLRERPAKREQWIKRGFKKIHGRPGALKDYWTSRVREDPAAMQLAETVWMEYQNRPQIEDKLGTGPGSQLKRMLSKIGIQPSPGCQCNKRAALMDKRGADWCEEHLEEIVAWLREEAQRAHLPFVDLAGRILIRRAIKLARATK